MSSSGIKVLLIDVDSTIPNLALMKISAYHKSKGDEVGFNVNDPDKVYASVIFKKNRHLVDGLQFYYPHAEIDIGGSGYDLKKVLPDEIERMTPDYDLYPECDRYYGFTTRGCIRHCPFCIVPKKEGKFRRLYSSPLWALESITGFRQKYDQICFLDNNILADKEWFLDLAEHLAQLGKKVDFNQGLDIRLVDKDIAKALANSNPSMIGSSHSIPWGTGKRSSGGSGSSVMPGSTPSAGASSTSTATPTNSTTMRSRG